MEYRYLLYVPLDGARRWCRKRERVRTLSVLNRTLRPSPRRPRRVVHGERARDRRLSHLGLLDLTKMTLTGKTFESMKHHLASAISIPNWTSSYLFYRSEVDVDEFLVDAHPSTPLRSRASTPHGTPDYYRASHLTQLDD